MISARAKPNLNRAPISRARSVLGCRALKPIVPADIGTDDKLPITLAIAVPVKPVIPRLRRERTGSRNRFDRCSSRADCARILAAKDTSKGRETERCDRNAPGSRAAWWSGGGRRSRRSFREFLNGDVDIETGRITYLIKFCPAEIPPLPVGLATETSWRSCHRSRYGKLGISDMPFLRRRSTGIYTWSEDDILAFDAPSLVVWRCTARYDGAWRRSSRCNGRRSRSPAG